MPKAVTEVEDQFVDLERHRLQLEENVSKLRESLKHWQTWEAEYEGIKEEIQSLGDEYASSELEHVANGSTGTQLNEKEIRLLLIDGKGQHRDSRQIIGLLLRRIEYVQQNVKTATSLLNAAEEKLAASAVISSPGVHNEERLPLTEIREELDEEGNVISSSISAPGNAAPQVVEALRKAGVKGLPDTPQRVSTAEIGSVDKEDPSCVTEDKFDEPATSILKSPKVQDSGSSISVSGDSSNEGAELNRRKSVTFAEGTKLTDAPHSKSKAVNNRRPLKTINEIKRRAGLVDSPGRSIEPSSASKDEMDEVLGVERAQVTGHATSGQSIHGKGIDTDHDRTQNHNEETPITSSKSTISAATTHGWPSRTTSHKENVFSEYPPNNEAVNRDADSDSPVIPADESPEDAALRRQMLEYSMNEVGSVVAEIELDEDDSDASYTDDEYGPNSDASSAEEDEDSFGRTKRRVLDDSYLEEMRALEKKLNATLIQNIGPQRSVAVPSTNEISSGKATSDDSLKDVSNLHTVRPLSKGVRFAEELDVQSAPPKAQENDIPEPVPRPVRDTIVERVTHAGSFTEPKPEPKKRTSRFMSAQREGHNSSQPDIEIAKPIADYIMERTASETSTPGQSTSSSNQFPNLATSATENGTRVNPSSPLNRTHNPIVIERPYSTKPDPSKACEPDELDPALLHQQVATEYHSMRNRMIQRQGGFLATDEEKAEVALTDEEGGAAPKISRFKAARLARLG